MKRRKGLVGRRPSGVKPQTAATQLLGYRQASSSGYPLRAAQASCLNDLDIYEAHANQMMIKIHAERMG